MAINSSDNCLVCQCSLIDSVAVCPFKCRRHYLHSMCAVAFKEHALDRSCPVCQSSWEPSLLTGLAILSSVPTASYEQLSPVANSAPEDPIADWVIFLCCQRMIGPPFLKIPDRRLQPSGRTSTCDYVCSGCQREVKLSDYLWLQDWMCVADANNFCSYHGSRSVLYDLIDHRVYFACTTNSKDDQPQILEQCTDPATVRAFESPPLGSAPRGEDAMMSWPHGGSMDP
jgi:hypothetical protein